jgi:type I restriction enzyme M protein
MAEARLFLYRFFNIRTIVSLPRNIFIDTPTLCSLVFAQKKTRAEIEAWDDAWSSASAEVERTVKAAQSPLRRAFVDSNEASVIVDAFAAAMDGVIAEADWVGKGGREPKVLSIADARKCEESNEAAAYLLDFIRTAGFKTLIRQHVFQATAKVVGYSFPVYIVKEVGYKLSKRKEKARLNQLCAFKGTKSKSVVSNLHLAGEECEVVVNKRNPTTVLDMIRKQVKWS